MELKEETKVEASDAQPSAEYEHIRIPLSMLQMLILCVVVFQWLGVNQGSRKWGRVLLESELERDHLDATY